jgi:poly-gamma-glutamate capsule biosynthesis protein CapA/YwtB (metallophosphatase superfamily)
MHTLSKQPRRNKMAKAQPLFVINVPVTKAMVVGCVNDYVNNELDRFAPDVIEAVGVKISAVKKQLVENARFQKVLKENLTYMLNTALRDDAYISIDDTLGAIDSLLRDAVDACYAEEEKQEMAAAKEVNTAEVDKAIALLARAGFKVSKK